MILRLAAMMVWILMLIMLIFSNTRLARLEAENKMLLGSYWQLYSGMQSRIAVVQQQHQALAKRHDHLLGLTGVRDVESTEVIAE